MDENEVQDVVETPDVPEQSESTPEVQPEPQGEVESEGKGAEGRIRELSHQTKVKDEEIRSLTDKINELTGPGNQQDYRIPEYNPNEPIVQAGEELDAAELNRRITERDQKLIRAAESRAELRSRQIEAENRHRSETDIVMRDYPQLNPDSKEFDPELSDTISEAVEAHLRMNPYSASVKKFTDKLMKPYKNAVDKEVGQATEKIAKQVTEAALRPTSVRKTEKTAQDKTIAELEAELGVYNS